MHMIQPHKKAGNSSRDAECILSRAAHKQHIFRKTLLWDAGAFLFAGAAAPVMHRTVLRFLPPLQWIVPVNESVWEHGKLLFFPLLFVGILRKLFIRKLQRGILTTFAEGILIGLWVLYTGFFIYSGFLGKHLLPADIALYYISLFSAILHIRCKASRQKNSSLPGSLLLLILTGCYIVFTYFPPKIGVFTDFSRQLQ